VAITLREMGKFQQTIDICTEHSQSAFSLGLQTSPLYGVLLMIEAEVLAEFGQLETAPELSEKRFKLPECTTDLTYLGWGALCLIRILCSKEDLTGIEEVIRKLETINREANVPPWIMSQMASWQARLELEKNNLKAASRWVEESGLTTDSENKPKNQITYFSLFDFILLARIWTAQNKLDEAFDLLNHLLKEAETNQRTSSTIEIFILLSLVASEKEDLDQAFSFLEQALRHGEPEGFVQLFVDQGSPIQTLLKMMRTEDTRIREYIGKILIAFGDKSIQSSTLSSQPLIDPLSEREIEVLQLIAEGLTNKEVGDRLFPSLNTFKIHTRNIYSKLAVKNRTQAISIAKEYDIFPPQ
jgi:LuxR family maltose regulon positive regulatory protein